MFTDEDREKALAARRAGPSRREKMAAFAPTFQKLRAAEPPPPRWVLTLIDAAEQGSMTAAISLMCLGCANGEKKEVRDCVIPACPLYPHRPYQDAKGRNPNDP